LIEPLFLEGVAGEILGEAEACRGEVEGFVTEPPLVAKGETSFEGQRKVSAVLNKLRLSAARC
jgi:hypothetical protein